MGTRAIEIFQNLKFLKVARSEARGDALVSRLR
jgi:hypothetical protein